MKIAFIGAGQVGAPLAARLAEAGHEVVLGEVEPGSESVARALTRSKRLAARSSREAISGAEIVFLATPFAANESLLRAHADVISTKILVDCTNPVGPGLTHALKSERSGSEFIQSIVPAARVVKAFTIYGFENLENSAYPGYGKLLPAMLFCGDDASAKANVASLITDLGFEPVDVGRLVQALHLEHMTLLWVRMVRAQGQSPHLVWAALRREHGA
ncbi:MAG: NADPH-dependent F420 reductase [Polyangiaceae bacterium]|nr:NADPH-dependent F420 reductase [Polyangiaceae bacterium]